MKNIIKGFLLACLVVLSFSLFVAFIIISAQPS
nr:MAG TPA: hypothetical protein [Bacteriophage sp.]